MFFHGFPSSRLEAKPVDNIASHLNFRIISPDRPGFGLSTFQQNRSFMDWPADVQALARHLGISRFALLGGSGGGPYALACAHALPREMLSAVGILAGAPPWEAGSQDILLPMRTVRWWADHSPNSLAFVGNGLMKTLQWALDSPTGARYMDNVIRKADKDGKSEVPIEEQRKALTRMMFEGFAQGGDAFVQEIKLLTSNDWGFKFADVNYDKIQIWHGTRDVNAPIRMIRYMAEHLPHSVLQEFDDTHFTIASHLREIFSELAEQINK